MRRLIHTHPGAALLALYAAAMALGALYAWCRP